MISIVGMACQYPDASTPYELWQNILSKRISFRKIPIQRLDLTEYRENTKSDSIYIKEAGLIEGYHFDRSKYKISGSTFRSTDLTHWLALDVAYKTLVDAGLPDGNGLDKQNTAVIVGNTLTGEFSRASLMRLRWPYVKKTIKNQLQEINWQEKEIVDFLNSLEEKYKSSFEPPGEDSLSGGLSNTIAGRICNYFNFNGGGYTVDGACSSSLLAINNACNLLECKDVSAVLVGGVDISIDPFELIGFSRIGAMAKKEMRVYDKNPTGFLPGEGCGFLLLMNREEALSMGLRSYADIKGWGISSDGGGGLTRPEKNGQKLALQRAYKKAKYDINTVYLFEGHGTGTSVGDEVELSALSELLTEKESPPIIGSIKPNIGHTKAAAGIAGVIKAVMSVNNQVISPIVNTNDQNEILNNNKLRIIKTAELWPEDKNLRAGISSFGFGGINAHITIEGNSKNRRKEFTKNEIKCINSYQECEIITLSAETLPDLKNEIVELISQSQAISDAEITDLSFQLMNNNKNNNFRAAVVVKNIEDLNNKLKDLLKAIEEGKTFYFDKTGIFLNDKKLKLGLLFPGQASPVRFNSGSLKLEKIKNLYQKHCLDFYDTTNTKHAQPCIVLSELAGLMLLEELNISAEACIGHSLGELTALYWAEAINADDLISLSKERGKIMFEEEIDGAMAAVYSSKEVIEKLLRNNIEISAYNNDKQFVVSGDLENINLFVDECKKEKINIIKLPVKKPFHSSLMKNASVRWSSFLTNYKISSCKKTVISTVTGELVDNNIKDNLVNQFTKPVLFEKAFKNLLNDCDYFLEVGPGEILSNLYPEEKILPLDCCSESLNKMLIGIAAVYAFGGQNIDFDIFKYRFYKEYKKEKSFFSNPCETLIINDTKQIKQETNLKKELEEKKDLSIIDLFKKILSSKTELDIENISDDFNLLKDLHMNSINVGQSVIELSKMVGLKSPVAPTEFANSTIKEIAFLIENKLKETPSVSKKIESIDDWVKIFNIELKEFPLIEENYTEKDKHADWVLFSNKNKIANNLFKKIKNLKNKGILICLNEDNESLDNINLLLEASKYATKNNVDKIVLLQHDGFAKSFIKSLNEELNADLVLLDTPSKEEFIELIIKEIKTNKNIVDCIYDDNKKRYEKTLKLVNPENKINLENKKILVTGGGKGITFECIYALSKKYKNELIILGKSEPEKDKNLSNNLDRLKKSNVKFSYFSVDIAEKEGLKKLINDEKESFSKIYCIIHGAGVNTPSLIGDLTFDKIKNTLNPKVFGIKNLLELLDVKLLINFSSIIALTGMAGEAHYAYANSWIDWLSTKMTEKTISIDWSVWSGVGMGEKLGKINELLEKGITPITPEIGVECFLNLIGEESKSNVLVSGRLGNSFPVKLDGQKSIPFYRFLENVKVYYPSIEIICESYLNLKDDLYLKDHIYKNESIFPVAMGIEAIIQAAQALMGNESIPVIKNLKLDRPIVINEEGTTLRIIAILNQDKINVVLRSSQTNFQINHFSCYVCFENKKEIKPIEVLSDDKVELTQDYYGKLFFQSGVFSCVQDYNYLKTYNCSANLKTKESLYFSNYLPSTLVAGDPGLRDSSIHCLQACLPSKTVLPVSVKEWKRINSCSKQCVVNAQQIWEKDGEYCFNVSLINDKKEIIEFWEELLLKDLEYNTWNSIGLDLINPYLNRESKKYLEFYDYNVFITNKNNKDIILKNCSKSDIKLSYRSDGKPLSDEGFISFSDSENLFMGSFCQNKDITCDIEKVTNRNLWKELIGEHYALADFISKENKEDINKSSTRIWSALESIKKAGLPGGALSLKHKDKNHVVFESFNFLIYSTILDIKEYGDYSISILIKNESI